MSLSTRIRSSLRIYTDRRMLVLLALGFSSGLPFLLVYSTLSVWLDDVGVDIKVIGFFAAARAPYSFKPLWAPLVDRLPLPILGRQLGRRRGWMLITQLGLAAAIAALALSDPSAAPLITAALAVTVAALAATQDIVIDAYRIDRLDVEEQGAGAAAAVMGYRLGMLAAGAGAFYMSGFGLAWSTVYLVMAALMSVGVITTLLCREPDQLSADPAPHVPGQETSAALSSAQPDARPQRGYRRAVTDFLRAAFWAPLRDFSRRRGFVLLLSFVLLYKLGDALAATMTNVFLVDIGFSKVDIANIAKSYGLVATILGVVLGGWFVRMSGVVWALWVAGFLQLGSNLMFSLQAWVGADSWLLIATVGVENITGGIGTAAFVAYLSGLCNREYSATQYALLTATAGLMRNLLATTTGLLVDSLGWLDFFIVTAAAAAPGLVVLYALQRLGMTGVFSSDATDK
ncbi:MAG: MFS transporter [Haliangiales bacterium]